jgi:hypothetical protein
LDRADLERLYVDGRLGIKAVAPGSGCVGEG